MFQKLSESSTVTFINLQQKYNLQIIPNDDFSPSQNIQLQTNDPLT